MINFQFLRP